MYYDSTYILVIIGLVICLAASAGVKSTFSKYSKVGSRSGIRAEQVAAMILKGAGIYDVRIERISGDLTDHYSPKEKVLRLSDSVYGSTSVAAIGVAAHECGHAIQHSRSYMPLVIRSAIIPVANIGSALSIPLVVLGLVLSFTKLAMAGVILFSVVVALQMITLPVEFNASDRAIDILGNAGILYQDELKGAKKVLSAAAMTYVAAMVSSMLQLLRLVMIVNRRR